MAWYRPEFPALPFAASQWPAYRHGAARLEMRRISSLSVADMVGVVGPAVGPCRSRKPPASKPRRKQGRQAALHTFAIARSNFPNSRDADTSVILRTHDTCLHLTV